jgi:hypothetical protein
MVGGIGGGGPPGKVGGVKAPATPATEAKPGTNKTSFSETLGTKQAEATTGASPLERLRAGEIDLSGYVDLRVREATSHLEGVLSSADLEKVQDQLREVIENDPEVAALVKGAEIGR